jgi:hypothetical protein
MPPSKNVEISPNDDKYPKRSNSLREINKAQLPQAFQQIVGLLNSTN